MRKIKLSIVIALSVLTFGEFNAQIDRSKAPEPGEAPKIDIGTPATFTLDNGLKVFIVENHKLPKISLQLSVDLPLINEEDKVGLAEMTGQLLSAGTESKTKEQIDKEVDFIGASLTTTGNGIYASALSKHTNKIMSIMSDIILNPSFPKEQLEKDKKRAISGLKSVSSNPDQIASRVSNVVLYGKSHPYGEIQMKEHIENIDVDDCEDFYEDYFVPNISYLVIVGDITTDKAKELVTKYFSDWEKNEVKKKEFTPKAKPEGVNVVFVEKPGAVQSVVKVMYPIDLPMGSEDAAAVKIMNGIFGGAFSSRLNMKLREAKGYTYGAGGGARSDKYIGYFTAGASVRNEVTDSAITEIFYEMDQMMSTEVTADELSRNINFNNGKFALSLESSQTVARFALNTEKYDLPADYYTNYLSRLNAVTQADVLDAAKKYIDPKNCYVLVVGSSDIAENLKKFDSDGKLEFYNANGEIVTGEKKELPEGLTGMQVIDDYVLAYTKTDSKKAALKKLKKVKAVSMTSEAEMQGQKITMKIDRKAPNMMKNEMSMSGMTIQKTVFNGKTGGSTGMQGSKELEGEELEEMKLSSLMHIESKYEMLGFKANLLSIEEVNGSDAYVVEVMAPGSESKELVYYDIESKLKVKSSEVRESPEGDIEIVTEYLDYKEVDGLLFPHTIIQNFGPQTLEMEVKELEVNPKISKKEFVYDK